MMKMNLQFFAHKKGVGSSKKDVYKRQTLRRMKY